MLMNALERIHEEMGQTFAIKPLRQHGPLSLWGKTKADTCLLLRNTD
jgi:hypothetical protein